MQNMNIVVDLREKMFKSCVDENIFILDVTSS